MVVYALCLHYDGGGITDDSHVISLYYTKEQAFVAGKVWEKSAQQAWEKHHEPTQIRPMFTGEYAGEYGSYYVRPMKVE